MTKIQNPYRSRSLNHRVMAVMLRSRIPLSADIVAKRCKLPLEKGLQVVAALANPYHAAVGLRAGLRVVRKDNGYIVERINPKVNARRPNSKRANRIKPR